MSPGPAQRENFFGFLPREVDNIIHNRGLPRFRGQQMRDWVYGRHVASVEGMTNISKRDRAPLADRFDFEPGRIIRHQVSSDGTIKLLMQWPRPDSSDLAATETVMIPDADRCTACVSSQIGCPVGCRFCASGLNGLKGNLEAGEIVFQIFALNRLLSSTQRRVTNIVFMGMGEPLANYANVMRAIRIIHDPRCLDLGARRITVSTVGVPKRIRDLAEEQLPLNLALSLHAPNEALRKQLIPWADHFTLDDILDACRYYFDRTGREVTLEYILLHQVNDRPEHARELATACRTLRANVNLIRYNEVDPLPFVRPQAGDVLRFQEILRDAGINAHVRRSRGRDIDAACGQLRRRTEQEPPGRQGPLQGIGVKGQVGRHPDELEVAADRSVPYGE